MSNNNQDWYDELDDDLDLEDDVFEEPKPSRRGNSDDTLKEIRRADRAKQKRIKELEAELSSLRTFQRESVVKSVLTDKGINPKIASIIPSDISADADSISTWIEQYADVFGIEVQSPNPGLSQEDMATLGQINSATQNALQSEMQVDLASAIANAESVEDIMNLFYDA